MASEVNPEGPIRFCSRYADEVPSIRFVMFVAPDPETQCRWWADHIFGGEPQHEGLVTAA